MGRHRSTNHDLPPRMARKGMRYYYVCNSKPRKWLPLGPDLAAAKRRWAEIEAAGRGDISVGDLVQRFIDREVRPERTLTQYRSYHKAIAEAFPIPAAELRSQHVALWRELQAHRKGTANGCIAVLQAAFRLGHEMGLCELITVTKWHLADRDRVLSDDEFRRIRAGAVEWLQVAMDLAYLTGSRPSDILALRWANVGERIAMRQIKTKARLEFDLTPDLSSVLDRARQRRIVGLYVVATDKGRPVSRWMLNDAWRAACDAAGVLDAQFRDLRPMAAAASEAAGQDYRKLLGHTTQAMSDRYLKGRRTIAANPVRKKL